MDLTIPDYGSMIGLYKPPKQTKQKNKKTKNTCDVILMIVGVFLCLFTLCMIWLWMLTGGVPDTLVSCVFTACTGECGFMGIIKAVKVLQVTAQLNKESKQLDLDAQQAKIAADKKELAIMATKEAGK